MEAGCRGPAASYVQHLTAGRISAQFAVWYLLLVLSRKGFQGYWSPSLLPDVTDNFWQDLCFGACLVRPAYSASQSSRRGAVSITTKLETLLHAQCTMLHALTGSFCIAVSA
jgi:hypothetical protein